MPRLLQIATFVVIVSLLIFGIHYYFWVRLVRDPALPGPYRGLATAALVALALSLPAALILGRLVPGAVTALSWLAFTWMGTLFLLFVALLLSDLGQTAVQAALHLSGRVPDVERRLFLSRLFAGLGAAFALGESGLALREGLGVVEVKALEIGLARLPSAFEGFTVAMISDVHLGPTLGARFMADVVARVNALQADLVVIVGDLVDGSVAELGPAAAPLAKLRAPQGVVFVTGNHEFYSGVDAWLAHLRTLGIRVLVNERMELRRGEATLDLAGTDDLQGKGFGRGPDLPRALAGRDPSRAVILLAHQPRTFPDAVAQGVDLQLSGHTHGGQLWPLGYLVKLQQGFLAGLSRRGASQLYVSRGTGYWGPPMRLGAPAEITRLVLRRDVS